MKIYYGFYDTREIQRGDIAVLRAASRTDPIINIVRAVPGDRFELKDLEEGGTLLLINGAELKNSAGRPYKFSGKRKQMLSLYERDYKGVIPANSYLLLGNLAEGSLDSSRFGLVEKAAIIGKASSSDK
ncbi:MAG: signal peptidase I [Elusimicrobia bacterium]|nr:signal peptidase I [Elusimicrobiota bacterium]